MFENVVLYQFYAVSRWVKDVWNLYLFIIKKVWNYRKFECNTQ